MYASVRNLATLQMNDQDLSEYLIRAQSTIDDLKLMLVSDDITKILGKLDNMLMVFVLHDLSKEYSSVKDQALTNITIPTVEELIDRLVRVFLPSDDSYTTPESSDFVSTLVMKDVVDVAVVEDVVEEVEVTSIALIVEKMGTLKIGVLTYMATRTKLLMLLKPLQAVNQRVNSKLLSLPMSIRNSGASDHLTGNASLFSELSPPKYPHYITIADGSRVEATGVRRDRSMGQTIGVKIESSGLYYLQPPTSIICVTTESPDLLHRRLGHLSLSKLKKMVSGLPHLESLQFDSCQLGKQVRVSFSRHINSRALSLFDVVHCDVWGPSWIPSILGYRYYVTFIDDFSRCIWMFLMKDRFELFNIFKNFCSEISTQFGKTICILHSDNAKEYFSDCFNSLMHSKGIIHQSSCPHTPQQNGVAEIKHRHIVDTALTLLLNVNLPLKFWGDVVLTVGYLINRMSFSVLNDQVLHSLVHPTDPLYVVSPRVFGCVPETNLDQVLLIPYFESVEFNLLSSSSPVVIDESSLLLNRYDITYERRLRPHDLTSIPSAYTLASAPSPNLPIAICKGKGNCSTRNPYLIYNCVSYHRLFPIYCAFVTALASVSIPKTIQEALSHPGWSQAIFDEMPALESNHTWEFVPIYNCVSYHRLFPIYCAFVTALASISIPKTIQEALSHLGWRQTIFDEMSALESNHTWEFVPLPPGKSVVGCRWIFNVKVGPDGQVDRLKARFVAKGHTQVCGQDYSDTFSSIAKMAFVRLFLAMAAMK
ncbi:uncharacterized protein LOC127096364 [Lathyrus oleraceus]|uniref:uncharacterized protein LOC127096364 n=1 Tax=Pisum sativum TaxID=3888 RepID=UPI0021D21529|nr:uncharacterized protein LOC127096364 [Pisum sativum]